MQMASCRVLACTHLTFNNPADCRAMKLYDCLKRRRRILVVARAVGRFEIKRIISDKPFVTAMVQDIADEPPSTFQQAADISTAAMLLWECMQQVKDLAGKLYSHAGPIGE